jgi:hypothetical protein
MYKKTQKLILNWNALETLIGEAEEEKDDNTIVKIVWKMAEKVRCVFMFHRSVGQLAI